MDKAAKETTKAKFSLPESDRIYFKDFHFLEEPLIDRQRKREEQKRLAKLKLQESKIKQVEESKIAPLPKFSNMKDDSQQDRNLSKLRIGAAASETNPKNEPA